VKARAFVDLDPQHALDQVLIADLLAHPERHGRNLRVEQRVGGLAGQVVNDLEILPARVENLQHILVVDQ